MCRAPSWMGRWVAPVPRPRGFCRPAPADARPWRALCSGGGAGNASGSAGGGEAKRPNFEDLLESEAWIGTERSERPVDLHVPIQAFYVGRSINVSAISRKAPRELQGAAIRSQPDYVLMCVSRQMVNAIGKGSAGAAPEAAPSVEEAPQRERGYVAVFRFGSVCFLSFEDNEAQRNLLAYVRGFSAAPVAEGKEPRDEHAMWLRARGSSQLAFPNETPAERLDTNAVVVMATVLGQSVALDAHVAQADRLLERFRGLNNQLKETGRMPRGAVQRNLFRMIAENNAIHADVISGSHLRLFDKTEPAWKDAATWKLSNELREEFEMQERFSSLEAKMNLIHENSKFFLDVLHTTHSNRLETAILALIAIEVLLALLTHR